MGGREGWRGACVLVLGVQRKFEIENGKKNSNFESVDAFQSDLSVRLVLLKVRIRAAKASKEKKYILRKKGEPKFVLKRREKKEVLSFW